MVAVLDASAVVELVVGTRSGARIMQRISDPGISLHSPELLDLEVLHVLRRYERTGAVSSTRAGEAYRNLLDLDVRRHGHEPLLSRIWSRRHNLTAYDAAYVTLAEILDAPLLTTDRRLAGVPALPVPVEVFTRVPANPPARRSR
ncbi:type II toxin-antitoxin system VapC family toxin [Candidatus Palauibacter sp.]|uniref:type II toxin-antitoxin system VapC family toxin n=1 Tax=Candidatus Palauibacter sp. TaxID=3101350 RepID=UPI003B594F6C